MPAYWIAHAQVKDPVEYKKYTDRLPALFDKYGARILARGGDYRILEGDVPFERHVVIEFESLARAEAFFKSPEYQEAAAFRRQPGVAINHQIIVEGVDATPK